MLRCTLFSLCFILFEFVFRIYLCYTIHLEYIIDVYIFYPPKMLQRYRICYDNAYALE